MVARAEIEPLRSLAFGGISGSYADLGTPFDHEIRMIRIINDTDGNLIVTDDDTVAAGKLYCPANTFVLYDIQSNMNQDNDDKYVKAKGTQISVKQSTAPTTGSVYLEAWY